MTLDQRCFVGFISDPAIINAECWQTNANDNTPKPINIVLYCIWNNIDDDDSNDSDDDDNTSYDDEDDGIGITPGDWINDELLLLSFTIVAFSFP